MARKLLIGFLGTGKLEKTTYQLNGQKVEARFSVAAASYSYPDYSPHIFLTKEAYKTNWSIAIKEFKTLDKVIPEHMIIPSGRTEKEIWQLLHKLIRFFKPGDEVILDVTHGFRAQPILMLSTLFFLRTLDQIKVTRILYFSYSERKVQPVFDLTPLLTLFDWAQGLGNLKRFGEAREIKRALDDIVEQAWLQNYEAGGIRGLSRYLAKTADALATIRIDEAFSASRKLSEALPAARKDLQHLPPLKPIASFLKEAFKDYAQIAQNAEDIHSRRGLLSLARIIELYMKTEKYPEAITVAREALVTLRVLENNAVPTDPQARAAAEAELNAVAKFLKLKGAPANRRLIPCAKLWDRLADLRNDVDHAGYRNNRRTSDGVKKQARQYCEEVIAYLKRGRC